MLVTTEVLANISADQKIHAEYGEWFGTGVEAHTVNIVPVVDTLKKPVNDS